MPFICAALLGCAIVDQYSGRAIVYNLEAEQAQDQALLLNIVRAYLRRPMQFTTVSTITGIATASAGTQYTLPTNLPFRPPVQGATGIAAFPPLPSWQFSGSMSGGPAFTVPVLDTQEFYQGILKPIPGQIWDLYLQAGYPRALLFNLLVQKVVMRKESCDKTDHSRSCEFVFDNYVGDNIKIDLFQAVADYLIALGLTTQESKPPTVPFTNPKNINVRYVGAPRSASKPDDVEVVAPPGGSASSDTQPVSKSYKICFAPQDTPELVLQDSLCGAPAKSSSEITSSASVGVIADPKFVDYLMWLAGERNGRPDLSTALSKYAGRQVEITIYMRHTEGMIYYLGEVVRRELHSEFESENRPVLIREDEPYQHHPQQLCEYPSGGCGYVFRLSEAVAGPGDFLGVSYQGQWYSIPGGHGEETDYSTLSFDIIKQLLALNSSAKSLPQSSVVTTVGGQ
jgi:hypothetical protein